MPRTSSATEDALLASGKYVVDWRYEIANGSGTLIDVTNWVKGHSFDEGIDDASESGNIQFIREGDIAGVRNSLAPLWEASPLNRDDADEFAPQLTTYRAVHIYQRIGASFGDWQPWHEVFRGFIDDPEWGGESLTVPIRGEGGRLADRFIKTPIEYPSALLEDIIQSILTDSGTGIVLEVPVPSGWQLPDFIQPPLSVHEAAWEKAAQRGWITRYRWQPDDTLKYELFEPNRDTSVVTRVVPEGAVLRVNRIKILGTGVRNSLKLWFENQGTGAADFVEWSHPGSIAAYGEKWMQLAGEATKGIRTVEEATRMIEAVGADLAIPAVEMEFELLPDFRVQLGDVFQFPSLGKYFDTPQTWGVVRVRQEAGNQYGPRAGRTFVSVRGQPAGAYQKWINLGGGTPTNPGQYGGFMPEAGPLYGETSAAMEPKDGGLWLGLQFRPLIQAYRIRTKTGPTSDLPVPGPGTVAESVVLTRQEGKAASDPNWYTWWFMATTPTWWKRIFIEAIGFDGSVSPPLDMKGQALSARNHQLSPVENLTISREGDKNVLTFTTPVQDPDLSGYQVWYFIERENYVLAQIPHSNGGEVIVFEDEELQLDRDQGYEVYPWCEGVTGLSAGDVAPPPPPDDVRPRFVNETPKYVTVGGVERIQIDWECDDPAAFKLRIERKNFLAGVQGAPPGPSWVEVYTSPTPAAGTFSWPSSSGGVFRLVSLDAADVALNYSDWGSPV